MALRMRVKNKYRKPIALICHVGRKCSAPVAIWSLIGFLLMLHLYTLIPHINTHTKENDINTSHDIVLRELEEIEEETIHMPPQRKRSARAMKRKPKRPTTLIDEFLDESSPMRHVFFPGMKTAVDPRKDAGNESFYYYPGRIWLDTEGNPIQAHGGGILYDERSGTYYWYGEYKDGPTYHAHKKGAARVDIIGIGCYSSEDLWTWKNEGIVLPAETLNSTHDLHPSNVLERPKVIYNDRTRQYVMWMHVDDANYTRAHAGVAVSSRPTGPFHYLGSLRPHGCDSRDMTLFKDDNSGATAYLIYSSLNNSELHVGPLTDDYTGLAGPVSRILVEQHREAPAVFKHRGMYYMVTSGCTGWAPNAALAHTAESMAGPWETVGNPCVGGNDVFRGTTFFAQGSHVVPVAGVDGLFVFMADRWNVGELKDSRYVWLPLMVGGPVDKPMEYGFGFPVWSRVSVYWHRRWRLPGRGFGNGR